MKSLVVVFVVLAVLFTGSYCQSDTDYGVMIDAGSSGSRIYLYEWPHREENTLPLVEPTSINQTVVSMKINTPLSSFNANPGGAGKSLDPLIAYIKSNLDKSQWSMTPIYLKATAGMRALSQSDQDAIMANVRLYLHNPAVNPFEFKDDYAKVIPGTDEGVFGWITVNYALQVLSTIDPTTNGALDMGGASTQITFYPAATPSQNLYNFSLGPNTFPLYTYSYPLGQDQANRLILAGLLTDGVVDAQGNILNPCYLIGYNESYQSGPTLAVGTGNYAACRAAVLKYLVVTNSSCTSCGIGSVYQPPLNGNFYAFSAYAYTRQFFGISNTAPFAEVSAAGQAFCNLTWSQATAMYPNNNFAKQYCFVPTYHTEALLKFGFDINGHQITTQTQIGNIELTWALGGMIYEANLLPFGGDGPNPPTNGPNPINSSANRSGFYSCVTTLFLLIVYFL